MSKLAFSTVACPDWPLERVARFAAEHGFAGVELRTFGEGSTDLACDPALTDGGKVVKTFRDVGVSIAGFATGARFDDPIWPPVLGRVGLGSQKSVEAACRLVEVVSRCGGGGLRVYAYDIPGRERRSVTVRRITERLSLVCDHAWRREVRVVLENGGAFSSGSDLEELADRVDSPLLDVCYDLNAACAVGDDWSAMLARLAPRLASVRVKDVRDGEACPLGAGELPCEAFVRAAAALPGREPWIVHSWDRMWDTSLAPAEEALPRAAERLIAWSRPSAAGGAAA